IAHDPRVSRRVAFQDLVPDLRPVAEPVQERRRLVGGVLTGLYVDRWRYIEMLAADATGHSFGVERFAARRTAVAENHLLPAPRQDRSRASHSGPSARAQSIPRSRQFIDV